MLKTIARVGIYRMYGAEAVTQAQIARQQIEARRREAQNPTGPESPETRICWFSRGLAAL